MKERYWTGPMKAGPCVPLDEVSFCLLKARYGCTPFSDSEMVLTKRKEKKYMERIHKNFTFRKRMAKKT